MTAIVDGTTGVDTVQNGVVTQSKLAANVAANGPAFSVYRNTSQTISTYATVAADAKQYDTANAVSAGVFTAPVAGYYQFNGGVVVSTTACTAVLRFSKNSGAEMYYGTYVIGNVNAVAHSALIYLAAGDTVAMQVQFSVSQSVATGVGGNYFQGFLARSA